MSDNFNGPDAGADSYTEITTQSWFSRMAQSFAGLIVGPILVLVGIGILVWNEDRAVTTARSLMEGLGAVISVDATSPSAQNDGHLVHVWDAATAEAKLSDPDFQVSVAALTLHRRVEMMQWREHEQSHTEKNLGGSETTTKTYTYSREWSATPIDSTRFKLQQGHLNPAFGVQSRTIAAKDAKLGGFRLTDNLLTRLPAPETVPIDPTSIGAIKARLGRQVVTQDGGLFVGNDSASPQVGDLKINFTETPLGDVTVIAEQQGNGFTGYQTKAGDVLEEIRLGKLTPKQIFTQMESENNILTWILRAVGTVLVLVGFAIFFGPLSVVADFLPFLGNIVGLGTFFLAFSLTLIVVPVTIAIAWLAFRPFVSIGVLAAGAIGVVAIRFLWPAKRQPVRSINVPPPVPAQR